MVHSELRRSRDDDVVCSDRFDEPGFANDWAEPLRYVPDVLPRGMAVVTDGMFEVPGPRLATTASHTGFPRKVGGLELR